MKSYKKFPLSLGHYLIVHEVPYDDLTPEDKISALGMFRGTPFTKYQMRDYIYLCNVSGGIAGRKFKKSS